MQIIRISLIATLAMVSVAQDIPKTSQAAITARGPQPTEPPAIFKNHKLRRGIDSVWDRVTSKAESIGSAIASGDDDDETTTSGVSISLPGGIVIASGNSGSTTSSDSSSTDGAAALARNKPMAMGAVAAAGALGAAALL